MAVFALGTWLLYQRARRFQGYAAWVANLFPIVI